MDKNWDISNIYLENEKKTVKQKSILVFLKNHFYLLFLFIESQNLIFIKILNKIQYMSISIKKRFIHYQNPEMKSCILFFSDFIFFYFFIKRELINKNQTTKGFTNSPSKNKFNFFIYHFIKPIFVVWTCIFLSFSQQSFNLRWLSW